MLNIIILSVDGDLQKVLLLKGGEITEDGLKLGGVRLSPVSFKFRRFSTKINIATAIHVEEKFEKRHI